MRICTVLIKRKFIDELTSVKVTDKLEMAELIHENSIQLKTKCESLNDGLPVYGATSARITDRDGVFRVYKAFLQQGPLVIKKGHSSAEKDERAI